MENNINNNNDNHVIHLNLKKIDLYSVLKRKMKNYQITNFHFILDNNNYIFNSENIHQKTVEEDNPIYLINCAEEQKNKKLLSSPINLNHIVSQRHFIENDNFANNENFQYKINNKKGISKDRSNSSNELENMSDSSSRISDKYINPNEKDNENNNILLGKKLYNKYEENLDKIDKRTHTYNINKIENDGLQLINPRAIISQLIKKYSYQIIFNIFLELCSKYYIENDNKDNKEVYTQLEKLINNIGIQEIMKIILLIGNSRGELIQYTLKKNIKKEMGIIEEKNNKNNIHNLITLEEEKRCERNIDTLLISLSDEKNESRTNNIDENSLDKTNKNKHYKLKRRIYDLLFTSFHQK